MVKPPMPLYIYYSYQVDGWWHSETTHATVYMTLYILLLPGLMDGGIVKPPMGLDLILRLVGTIEVGDLHACIRESTTQHRTS